MQEKPIDIPSGFLTIRKVSRWFAGLWYLIALVLVVSGIGDVIENWRDLGAYTFIPAVAGIVFAASAFWFVPGWFIRRYQRSIAEAMNDPTKDVHMVKATTATGEFSHVEIVSKTAAEESAALPEEDASGRILFDSTQRPLRVLFSGAFLGIGLIIGLIIYFAADEFGGFEIFWVSGWCGFCLVVMGWVYEISLNKRNGLVEKKAGWFFFVRTQRYRLRDFDRIIVESTFQRSRYDSIRDRYASRDPRFSVDLAGNRRVTIRVFNRVADARHLAKALADYLELPLAETTEVHG
jgi:hypothetical protein